MHGAPAAGGRAGFNGPEGRPGIGRVWAGRDQWAPKIRNSTAATIRPKGPFWPTEAPA
jgi:hypothetical protein